MSKTIHISVNDKIAAYRMRDGEIVCGNSDYTIEFAFDSEWDAETTKTARFSYNGVHEDVIFSGNTVSVPVLRNVIALSVGVFAGNLRTTTPAFIPCRRSILCDGGVPAAPGEDVYNQIMELLNTVKTGWTTEQIDLLETVLSHLAYDDASTGQTAADSLIASLRGSGTEPTDDISQSGSVLTIRALANKPTQSGSVLSIT